MPFALLPDAQRSRGVWGRCDLGVRREKNEEEEEEEEEEEQVKTTHQHQQ